MAKTISTLFNCTSSSVLVLKCTLYTRPRFYLEKGKAIPNSEKRTRNSHAFKYRMPKVSKDVFKFSFFPRSITEWNLLPADLVNCKSLSNFKLNLGKLVNK